MSLSESFHDFIMPETLSLISVCHCTSVWLCDSFCVFLTCCPSALAVNVYEREGLTQCSSQEGDAALVAGSIELYRSHHSSALLLSSIQSRDFVLSFRLKP